MGAIYILVNAINGKHYVGQTTNIKRRLGQHLRFSSHSLIANAYKKYGRESFLVYVLDNVPEDELDYWEIHYIEECHSLAPDGYNLEAGGSKYKHFHEETRKKISIARTGKLHSEESKEKNRQAHLGKPAWNKGKSFSDEAKLNMSLAHKGLKTGRPAWNKGILMDDAIREKMRISHLGKSLSEQTKKKIAMSHCGKSHSEDTKYKISLTLKTQSKKR